MPNDPTIPEPLTGSQIGEIRVSKLLANVVAIPFFALTFAPAFALYLLLPHAVDPGRWELWIFLGATLVVVVLLRKYDGGAYVRDAKGEPGCDIFEAP